MIQGEDAAMQNQDRARTSGSSHFPLKGEMPPGKMLLGNINRSRPASCHHPQPGSSKRKLMFVHANITRENLRSWSPKEKNLSNRPTHGPHESFPPAQDHGVPAEFPSFRLHPTQPGDRNPRPPQKEIIKSQSSPVSSSTTLSRWFLFRLLLLRCACNQRSSAARAASGLCGWRVSARKGGRWENCGREWIQIGREEEKLRVVVNRDCACLFLRVCERVKCNGQRTDPDPPNLVASVVQTGFLTLKRQQQATAQQRHRW
nr:hypothetical protein CFP56_03719 [Quercus suber]